MVGASGDRRRQAGRDHAGRDLRPIFRFAGDGEALRQGPDPQVPEEQSRRLPAEPRYRSGRGIAARPRRKPALHPYRKGAVEMYWLKETVGEEKVNAALRKLLAKYAFKAAPYPSTTDFLAMLKEEAGPAFTQQIDDQFDRITLYDLKATDAKGRKR